MKAIKLTVIITPCLLILILLLTIRSGSQEEGEERILRILWAEWTPADKFQELCREFTEASGIRVDIEQRPWGELQNSFFSRMEEKDTALDLVIGDSQWLGWGATGGHYIPLSNWMKEQGVLETMNPHAIQGYSEYPKDSGRYWAVPLEGDLMAFAYRKDLFQDPEERKRFFQTYSYPLAIPDTWNELRDIAEHFYRPEEQFFGVLLWNDPYYDGLSMGVQTLIWAWGGMLGDRSTFQVQGMINSQASIQALSFYRELNRFNNPAWRNHYLDTERNSNTPIQEGKVAISMTYLAIAPDLLDPLKNPLSDTIGFFPVPAGPGGRASSLGGQGISVISYSQQKEEAFHFLRWFIQEETQRKWSELGGLSCDKRIINSQDFLYASPVHSVYKSSIPFVRDFWTVPEYDQLLSASQTIWDSFLRHKELSASMSMEMLAQRWEEIFENAGYYRE